MRVKLNQLHHLVQKALNEEKATELLRIEVTRVLGPIMDTSVRLEELAESVNDRIAVMERTGRESHLTFKPSILIKFLEHKNPEVRSMCGRLLPTRFLHRLKSDCNSMVRNTIAKRVELPIVLEMVRKLPKDIELRRIYKQRKQLNENTRDDIHQHYKEKQRLGDAVKQQDSPGLSDEWYRMQADLFMQDYGQDMYETTGQAIDYNWEATAVKNFCRHSKATSGVEIDEDKLMKALHDNIVNREDEILKRESTNNLKTLASKLYEEHSQDVLNESKQLPELIENIDFVNDLYCTKVSPATYIKRADDMFNIKFSKMPLGLKKYRMGEGIKNQMIPMKGSLPHNSGFRNVDECALDLYVEHWNKRQALSGEPVRIKWNPDPGDVNVFGFEVILR